MVNGAINATDCMRREGEQTEYSWRQGARLLPWNLKVGRKHETVIFFICFTGEHISSASDLFLLILTLEIRMHCTHHSPGSLYVQAFPDLLFDLETWHATQARMSFHVGLISEIDHFMHTVMEMWHVPCFIYLMVGKWILSQICKISEILI